MHTSSRQYKYLETLSPDHVHRHTTRNVIALPPSYSPSTPSHPIDLFHPAYFLETERLSGERAWVEREHGGRRAESWPDFLCKLPAYRCSVPGIYTCQELNETKAIKRVLVLWVFFPFLLRVFSGSAWLSSPRQQEIRRRRIFRVDNWRNMTNYGRFSRLMPVHRKRHF